MIAQGGPLAPIGMGSIKQRRLVLPVKFHPQTHVGDYVPFYFCSRSIMLFVIHCANHPELTYRGGQSPIVHLEADLEEVVAWAKRTGRLWAFSLSNAGAAYAQFRGDVGHLNEINWEAVNATDFRDAEVKEGKQAEFLVQDSFPWELVSKIGVLNVGVRTRVVQALHGVAHAPPVELKPNWYY